MEPRKWNYDHSIDAMRYVISQMPDRIDRSSLYVANNYFIQADNIVREMNRMSADEKLANILEARKEEAELEKKIALVDDYGKDTFENGIVLKFSKLYGKDATVYNYAVLKTAGSWYATGAINGWRRGTWDDLVLSLVSGDFPVTPEEVIVITGYNTAEGSVSLHDYRVDINE